MSRALARDRLGVPAVLAFVLAGVAPLTVAAGVIPTAYATTGLTAIPAAFLVVVVILGIFATGYVAMAGHVTNSGAIYAFVARGLGRPVGVAAALVALVAYSFLQVGLYGAFGPAAASEAAAHLGVHGAWWQWALGAWAVIAVLGLLRVDITGWVLGVLLTVEIFVVLVEAVSGLADPAGGRLSFATLSPAGLTSGGFGTFGVLAVVVVLGFVGFEQAPVLAEEPRNARRHPNTRPSPHPGPHPTPPSQRRTEAPGWGCRCCLRCQPGSRPGPRATARPGASYGPASGRGAVWTESSASAPAPSSARGSQL